MKNNLQYQLYYIHGYQSSPTSEKARLFQKKLHAQAITYRSGKPEDLVIASCLQRIHTVIKDEQNVVLIGSSLGGFLAASIAENHPNVKKLILLNPALIPPTDHTHRDTTMPQRILNDMMDRRLFETKLDAEIYILCGTEDTVIPARWIIEFSKVQEATIRFLHDDHRFSQNMQRLPDIIATFL